ncbi:unnamed protein product [Brachionus calyciflorus]|uniref:Uncharacterized protein n=1 Tax=Brachionus calyciflorus TaxID=104777 RepID=A0A813SI91_9BILA|nr:unnamed protein product [Brachionus calyciflorus]
MSDQFLPISPNSDILELSGSSSDEGKDWNTNQKIPDKTDDKVRFSLKTKQTARKAISRRAINNLVTNKSDENDNYLSNSCSQRQQPIKTKQTARKSCAPYVFPVMKRRPKPIVVTEIDEEYKAFQLESNLNETSRKNNLNSDY